MVLSYVNVRVDPAVFSIFPQNFKKTAVASHYHFVHKRETSLRFWQSIEDQIYLREQCACHLGLRVVMEEEA